MIKRLAHVCIGAADLERTEQFYVDLLGMEIVFEFLRGGERIGFYLRALARRHFWKFLPTRKARAQVVPY